MECNFNFKKLSFRNIARAWQNKLLATVWRNDDRCKLLRPGKVDA